MNLETIAQSAWVLTIQATLMLALGLLIAFTARKKGAAWQTNILRTTLVATITLCLVGPMLKTTAKPVWTVPDLAAGPRIRLATTTPQRSVAQEQASLPRIETELHPVAVGETVPSNTISFRDLALYVWATGVSAGALWILFGVASLLRLRFRSSRPEKSSILTALEDQSVKVGVSPPAVFMSPRITTPFVSGIFRPAIFLPEDCEQQYDAEQIRTILAHELVHIRHRDCLWGWIARIAVVLAWPHPLTWILQRKLREASEELCDQGVLKSGLKASNYADCLLKIADRSIPTRTERMVGVSVVPIRSTLGRRISLVLDTSRTAVTRISMVGRVTITGLICLAVGAIAIAIVPNRGRSQNLAGDPAARKFAKEVNVAYANLSSIVCDISVLTGSEYNSKRVHFSFRKPELAKIDIFERDRMEVGQTLYVEPETFYLTTPHHPNEFLTQKSSADPDWRYKGSLGTGLDAASMQSLGPIMMLFPGNNARNAYDFSHSPCNFGPDTKMDGVACKSLVVNFNQPNGATTVERMVVGIDDHLVREFSLTMKRNGHKQYETANIYSNIHPNASINNGALTFNRNRGWKEVDRPTFRGEFKLAPAAEALVNTLNSARSISFVDDEATGQERDGGTHRSMNHLTVQISGALRHVKLELDDYPHSNLEVWSNGKTEDIVEQGNKSTYIEKQMPKGSGLFDEIGIPAGACPSGFGILGQVTMPAKIGFFRGIQGLPTTFDGEPVDVIVQKQNSQDQYGFPIPDGGSTKYLISQRDHMLRQVETMFRYRQNGKWVSNSTKESFRNVKIDSAIPGTAFEFKPAPGMHPATEVAHLEPGRVRSETAIDQTLPPGQSAPNFHSTLINGSPVSLSKFKGKVVFLHGWTFGIYNYVKELPLYERIYQKFKSRGLVMLGVPYEPGSELKNIVAWLKKNGITHPQIFDGKGEAGGIQSIYKMGGRPFVFVIDRQGIVYAKPFLKSDIESVVQAALNKK